MTGITVTMKTPNGETISTEDWKNRAHELVFEALDQAARGIDYPADKGKVVREAQDAEVLREPRMRLKPFLDTLPERTFQSREEVARALNDTWETADEAPTGTTGRFP